MAKDPRDRGNRSGASAPVAAWVWCAVSEVRVSDRRSGGEGAGRLDTIGASRSSDVVGAGCSVGPTVEIVAGDPTGDPIEDADGCCALVVPLVGEVAIGVRASMAGAGTGDSREPQTTTAPTAKPSAKNADDRIRSGRSITSRVHRWRRTLVRNCSKGTRWRNRSASERTRDIPGRRSEPARVTASSGVASRKDSGRAGVRSSSESCSTSNASGVSTRWGSSPMVLEIGLGVELTPVFDRNCAGTPGASGGVRQPCHPQLSQT